MIGGQPFTCGRSQKKLATPFSRPHQRGKLKFIDAANFRRGGEVHHLYEGSVVALRPA